MVEKHCSTAAVNTRDALGQALETAQAEWQQDGNVKRLRRGLLAILQRLDQVDE